jgi:hypothetical protein
VAALAVGALAGCGRIGFDPVGDAAVATGGSDAAGSAAAIAFVQATPVQNTVNASKATVTFLAPPAPGDVVVLAVWTFAGTTMPEASGFTDNAGNVYELATSVTTTACGTGAGALAIYDAVAGGDQPALQVPYAPAGSPTQNIDMMALEYTGAATLDRTAMMVTPPGTSPHMFSSGTTAALSADHELLVGVGFSCSGSPGTVTFTDDAGFTTRGQENMTENDSPGIIGDLIVDQGGTATDTWTATYQSDNEVELGAIATFR